jgi:acetyl esterase/lipase
MTRSLKAVALAAGALGAGALGAAVSGRKLATRHRDIRELVAADLRSPLLYVNLPTTSARGARALRRVELSRMFPLPSGVTSTRRTVGGGTREPVTLHLYEPVGRQRPSGVLYWIHGGGFVIGSAVMGQSFGGRVAQELGVLVVSVEYRLAPDHPFPAPLEDCYTGLAWVHEHADELGVDPTRIAVGGESAGGGLAATLAQLAHDRGEVPLCFQLLVYPMADDRTVVRADHGRTGRVGWDPASNRFGWTSYLGHPPGTDTVAPYAVTARRADLTGLPPAWIGVGDIDLFHDEDLEYAERLRAAGVPVDLVVVPGMPHGADVLMPQAPQMVAFNDAKLAALRRALVA